MPSRVEVVSNDTIQLANSLADYHGDPRSFVREVFRATPTHQQDEFLEATSHPGAHVTVRAGHGTGKSSTLAWLSWHHVWTNLDALVPCTAPSAHQLEDVLWGELSRWRMKMPPEMQACSIVNSKSFHILGLEKVNFGVARTARKENSDALQGFHSKNLLFLIDEASGVHDKIYEVASGALSTEGAKVVLTGNPTRIDGYFHGTHMGPERDLWTRLHFSCVNSPLASKKYIEDMRIKYGEDSDVFLVRVLGDFPRHSILQLIGPEIVDLGWGKHLREDVYANAPRIIGVDVSYFGDDRSTVWYRQGLMCKLLWRGRNVDTVKLAGIAGRFATEMDVDAINVDVTGWGAGVVDNLKQMGFKAVFPIYAGGSADDPLRFVNKRAEFWWLMREWLEAGGAIPEDQELRDDLQAPEYWYTPAGKVQLESKDDLKARGLSSPDNAEGLGLTFAVPTIQRKAVGMAGMTGKTAVFASTAYNRNQRRR